MKKLSAILIVAFVLGACSTGVHIEKRRYRTGFYVSGLSHHEKTAEQNITGTDEGISECEVVSSAVSDDKTEETLPITVVTHVTEEQPAQIDVTHSTDEVADTIKPMERNRDTPGTNPLPYEGPVDAQGMNIMLLIALGLLIGGILLAVVAFAPALYIAVELVFLTPFLVIGAIVLSAIVATKAKRRRDQYAVSDRETSDFYRKMRIQALAILWIASAIAAIFIIGLTAAILALSGW